MRYDVHRKKLKYIKISKICNYTFPFDDWCNICNVIYCVSPISLALINQQMYILFDALITKCVVLNYLIYNLKYFLISFSGLSISQSKCFQSRYPATQLSTSTQSSVILVVSALMGKSWGSLLHLLKGPDLLLSNGSVCTWLSKSPKWTHTDPPVMGMPTDRDGGVSLVQGASVIW